MPAVNEVEGPERPDRDIYQKKKTCQENRLKSRRFSATNFISVNSCVYIIPLLDFDSQNIIDAKSLQPLHGQWSRKVGKNHVVFCERLKDMLGNKALALVLEGVCM
jgi:hypothetical protein